MPRPTLEICVDTWAGALAAAENGADRIELCAALSEGGLTPSQGFIARAATLPVPVYAMIRPRGGDFAFSPEDEAIMAADIAVARAAGLAGVVLGAGTSEGLDTSMLARLSAAAEGMGRTLHRVFDTVSNREAALDAAVGLGFERILTSGGAPNAPAGAAEIARLAARTNGRLSLMPGAGVTAENAGALLAATGATELHASARDPATGLTDPARIRRLRAALS